MYQHLQLKFVKFTSVYDPDQMKGQRFPVLNWPYKEGLRIDEAMHPLTIMVTGLYGKELPNQKCKIEVTNEVPQACKEKRDES